MKNMQSHLADKEKKLLAEAEHWESGELGLNENYQKPAPPEAETALDGSLGLKMVSIRLPVKIVDALKALAKENMENYQPYVRRILVDHVKSKSRVQQSQQISQSAYPENRVGRRHDIVI